MLQQDRRVLKPFLRESQLTVTKAGKGPQQFKKDQKSPNQGRMSKGRINGGESNTSW